MIVKASLNVVVWVRVSSREQREGYSLDAQLRAVREKAAREGWQIVREFVVAESAKRGAERQLFKEMVKWVKSNAKRLEIGAILSHKLDRVCRNMRDAVRLQELEDECGVNLAFVENEFAPGPAGALSFNVMAAVAQYYSDNLRTEVLKGLDERVRQGWPHGVDPFGYRNDWSDRAEPVKPHPDSAPTVVRIFELYSTGHYTFESLAAQLKVEGRTYRKSDPDFTRPSLSYILNNRIYIGEIKRGTQYFPGKHRPLIDRATWQACQALLKKKNRRNAPKRPEHMLAGGLFHCQYCGHAITGERIRRKLKGGGVREHQYYRCANNAHNHPTVRWRAEDLEQVIFTDLEKLKLPTPEIQDWFRKSLREAFSDLTSMQKAQAKSLVKRRTEIKNMQDRLLNGYLLGGIDEATLAAKQQELKDELAEVERILSQAQELSTTDAQAALAVFDFSQNVAEIWAGSNMLEKREILESVSLNRRLGHLSLCISKGKPFDIFAERPEVVTSRDDWRFTFLNDLSGPTLLQFALSQTFEFTADTFFALGNY